MRAELVQYLVRALVQSGIVDGRDDETARNLLGGRSPRASLATLLAAAAAAGRRAVVFLDDVHLLTCPACLSLIRMLLDDSTSELRFVMASRRWPSLDVAKLQLQGTLRLIPAERLNFTLAEARDLLERGSSRGATASRLRVRARLAGGTQAFGSGAHSAPGGLAPHFTREWPARTSRPI